MDKKLSPKGHSQSESVTFAAHGNGDETNSLGKKERGSMATESVSTDASASDLENLPTHQKEKTCEPKRSEAPLRMSSVTTSKRIDTSDRIANSIREKRLRDELKRSIRTGVPTAALRAEVMDSEFRDSVWAETAEYLLVERELKNKGLIKEESDEILFSQLFDAETVEVILDQNESKVTDQTRGTFLGEDDYTDNDKLGVVDSSMLFPRLSSHQIWELARPAPSSLLYQMARKVDGAEIPQHIEPSLMGYVILFSREVESLDHFEDVVRGGLGRQHPGLEYQKYLEMIPSLKRQMRECLKWYFQGSHGTLKALAQNSGVKNQEALSKEFWQRFFKTLDSLTPKQRHALEKLYMNAEPVTYVKAAGDFKISVDSLRDRVHAAMEKFKKEFPELSIGIAARPTGSTSALASAQEDDKVEAAVKKKNLTPKEIAEIKAWAIVMTPDLKFS